MATIKISATTLFKILYNDFFYSIELENPLKLHVPNIHIYYFLIIFMQEHYLLRLSLYYLNKTFNFKFNFKNLILKTFLEL